MDYNFLSNLLLAKQGFYAQPFGEGSYDPYLYESGEQGGDEGLQEEEAISSFPTSDQLITSTEDQRDKREIQVDSKSPGKKNLVKNAFQHYSITTYYSLGNIDRK